MVAFRSEVDTFEYKSEIIQVNEFGNEANKGRVRQFVTNLQPKNIYNKKNLSRKNKIRHYTAIIKPESLYARNVFLHEV